MHFYVFNSFIPSRHPRMNRRRERRMKEVRGHIYSLLALFNTVTLGLLLTAIGAGAGDIFESIAMIANFLCIIAIPIRLWHKKLYRYPFNGYRQLEVDQWRNYAVFGTAFVGGLASNVAFSIRVVGGKLCKDFWGIPNPCVTANIMLVFSWLAFLCAAVGLLITIYDVPEVDPGPEVPLTPLRREDFSAAHRKANPESMRRYKLHVDDDRERRRAYWDECKIKNGRYIQPPRPRNVWKPEWRNYN